MKLLRIMAGLLVCLLILLSLPSSEVKTLPEIKPHPSGSPLYQFFIRRFQDPSGGVYTNLKNDHPESKDVVRNHVFLAESAGLLLNYAVNQQKKALYDQQVRFIKTHFLTERNLLGWFYDPKGRKVAESNAAVDDLRVIRGLLSGYAQWKNTADLQLALDLAQGLKKWNTKGNRLVDFYNWKDHEQAGEVTLSYLDLYTLKQLEAYDPTWKRVYEQSLALVKSGSLGNGLYRKTYDYMGNRWAPQPNVSLIDSFYTSLHLAEVGIVPDQTISFIKEQLRKNKKLYGVYSLNGSPAADFESPAVYGLAIRLLDRSHALSLEPEIMTGLAERLKKLQVQDRLSPYYGGFVDVDRQEAYSFDQLQVLLAESEVGLNDAE